MKFKLKVGPELGSWGFDKKIYFSGKTYPINEAIADAALKAKVKGLMVLNVKDNGMEEEIQPIEETEAAETKMLESAFVAETKPIASSGAMTTDDIIDKPRVHTASKPIKIKPKEDTTTKHKTINY